MSKRALLVGMSNCGDPVLKGVRNDVIRMDNYLYSNHGGAWERDLDEIKPLHNPEYEQLRSELRDLSNIDYAFVLLAGHGYISKETGKLMFYVLVNKEIKVTDIKNLYPKCNNFTLIIDCCRVKCSDSAEEIIASESMIKDSALAKKRIDYQRRFNDLLAHSGPGGIVIYSCSSSESSMETETGSFFITGLLKYTKAIGDDTRDYRTMHDAFNYAKPYVIQRRSPVRQNPQIEYDRMRMAYPFYIV